MRHVCIAVAAILVLMVLAWPAGAETVAHYRFEDGAVLDPLPKYPPGAVDSSGNGNDMDPWTAGGWAGFVFRDDVAATPTIFEDFTSNTLSVKNDGGLPGMNTISATTNPTIDLETMTPAAWTVEACFKPESTDGHRTIIGRDGTYVTDEDWQLAPFYLQVLPDEAVAVKFADMDGNWHQAITPPGAVTGFVWSENPDGANPYTPWYHAAACSDGQVLSLYLAQDGDAEYRLVAQTNLGDGDTRLATSTNSGGDWHGGAWTIGRGMWSGGHNDRAFGYVDEVRISNHARNTERAWGAGPALVDNVAPNVTFTWNTALDESGAVNASVASHMLYIQMSGRDPNYAPAVEIPASGTTGSYGPVAVGYDVTGYRWRVDEVLDDATVLTGPVWTFDTRPSSPVVIEEPATVVVDENGTAEFTVVVESESPAHYAWKKVNPSGEDLAVGTDSATLTITPVTLAEEGLYYVEVVNDSGTVVSSAQAGLAVARLIAHYPLDGSYIDASGNGLDADPNGVPTYVAGADGTDPGAVLIDTTGWATAGTWNPSEFSGELTVSFWMNWGGANDAWQTFIAKRNEGGFGSETTMWQVSADFNSATLWFQSPGDILAEPAALVAGTWQHVAVTFSGGTARIYLDGVEVAEDTSWAMGPVTDAMIVLGAADPSGGAHAGSALDDIRIYNNALSDIAVAHLYNNVSGESVCVGSVQPSGTQDLNGDCQVDLQDLNMFSDAWLECGLLPDCLE